MEIDYNVVEVNKPSDFKVNITGNQNIGFTVINTKESTEEPQPETKNITVNNVWNNVPKNEIVPVVVNLLANNEVVGTIKLDDSNDWTHVFKDLPTKDNGKSIKYKVLEIVPDGFKHNVVEKDNGFTIINSKESTPITPVEPPYYPPVIIGGFGTAPIKDNGIKHLHKAFITGYPDGSVRPDGSVTRAEAVAMVVRLKEYNLKDNSPTVFADTNDWFNRYINAAFKAGILEEKSGENFRPNEPITRAELAQLISHIDKANGSSSSFSDAVGHKFEAAINKAYGNKRIDGYPDGTFKLDRDITRAETAKILNSLFEREVKERGVAPVKADVKIYNDIDSSHWGYYHITEASNTH